MAGKTAVLIDGGYLDKINNGVKLDFGKLVHALASPQELWRAYYYHCPSYQSANPTVEQKDRYAKTMKFFDSLNRIERFTVRLGRLNYCGLGQDGLPRFEQKRVDLLLGLDIAEVSASGKIDVVVLLAGDGDFLPAILAAKEKMVLVRLAHGGIRIDPKSGRPRPSYDHELWDAADERVEVDQCFLKGCSK